MGNERFKNEIKGFSKEQLLEKYYEVCKEFSKWNSVRHNSYQINKLEEEKNGAKVEGNKVVQRHYSVLRKQRAILLTRLNQLGFNGKQLEVVVNG